MPSHSSRELLRIHRSLVVASWLTATAKVGGDRLGELVLAATGTAGEVAAYRGLLIMLSPITAFQGVLHQAVYPRVLTGALDARNLVRSTVYAAPVAAVVLLGGIGLVRPAMRTLLGIPPPALIAVALILVTDLLRTCLVWVHPVVMSLGNYFRPTAALIATFALWTLLSIALVPRFGVSGLGVVYLAAGVIPFGVYVGPLRRWLRRSAR